MFAKAEVGLALRSLSHTSPAAFGTSQWRLLVVGTLQGFIGLFGPLDHPALFDGESW